MKKLVQHSITIDLDGLTLKEAVEELTRQIALNPEDAKLSLEVPWEEGDAQVDIVWQAEETDVQYQNRLQQEAFAADNRKRQYLKLKAEFE
jgi:hypothetical protein